MNILVQPPKIKLEARQRFVLWNLGWQSYELIVEALNEQHVRTTYDRGDLELMSTLPIHELIKVWFGHFILALSLELEFAYQSMAQMTFRRRDRDRGLEPDDCYYLASLEKVVDWSSLNLDRDPPPDLALEVDVTTSCLDRMGVYAGLGVPEVWRFDGEEWHIHLLGADGAYRESPSSAALPYLPIPEITTLLHETVNMTDH
ncbi:MAG: Uma2 family endonuclease, partial [Gemmataceae bacterium]